MKNVLFVLFAAFLTTHTFAQFNVSYVGDLAYDQDLSDIWGYRDSSGIEYALVGVYNGLSIVSLEDPANPVEVAFVPGPNSIWRDIKTWDHYAYVINETGGGLLVVDLSNLPNNFSDADYYYWAPDIPGLGQLSSVHNLYIDEFGFCYLAGASLNSGGVLYIDVATDPWNPSFAGAGPPFYSHDVYARENKLYSSEIYQGRFAIYDVTDKTSPVLLGTQTTEANFTHNSWLSDDGTVLFTTDETANAPIGSYNVSDPANIQTLDQFRPLETLGEGVIPHNVHVFEDWVIVSYYTDGCIILDGSRPENLIEVGNFDTYIPANTGFNGAWGAYPFLPSGLILVSDIGNGLYVLEPNYVRACWLEGNVKDAVTGFNLAGVSIDIDSDELNQGASGADGNYATGQATPGTFNVTFSKVGYFPLTTEAVLENGVVTILDVELEPLSSYSVTGEVIRAEDGLPVPDAVVVIVNDLTSYETNTDADGKFSMPGVLGGDYQVFAGSWGYLHQSAAVQINGSQNVILELEEGYQDDFFADFGWEVTVSTATTGNWEWGVPQGTFLGGTASNPGNELPGDLGNKCYVTGNGGGGAGDDDVDNGDTELQSPSMALYSRYQEPVISYHYWFVNGGGAGDPNDKLVIGARNGLTSVVIHEITNSNPAWVFQVDTLSNYIEITDEMSVYFLTGDAANSGHIVEAAVDGFLVSEGDSILISTHNLTQSADLKLKALPNPFVNHLTVEYKIEKNTGANNWLEVVDLQGKTVFSVNLKQTEGVISLPNEWSDSGVYFIRLTTEKGYTKVLKVIKHNQ